MNVHEQHLCQLQMLQLHQQSSKAKQGCRKEGNQEANLDASNQPTINRPTNQPINRPTNQPINNLLCFIPVSGITDGEANQRKMTPDSDSICKGFFIQHCSIHYDQKSASQGELVEGCGKGEKRV